MQFQNSNLVSLKNIYQKSQNPNYFKMVEGLGHQT